ncbi:fungal-specific transcription factor domain-containing protein [Phaeosphaeriaceae sp. PMI808]|nr:fungal-specific transcription factor domain-containing protein [Phaeosphaeriaceae sp. PMI808]
MILKDRPMKRQKKSRMDTRNSTARPFRREHEATLLSFTGVTATHPMDSSLIMSPHMAEDITILEQYLTSQPTDEKLLIKPYRTVATSSGTPIVYLTVPRKRKGLRSFVDPGRKQREIIEHVLSPFIAEALQLYFDHLHPCFPILDEQTFLDLWQRDNERISSTLVCDVYASALLFWKRSDVLSQHAKPDPNFVWNQAVAALQDDFVGPTISTVYSALLDMVGRPIGAVTGNVVNCGRVVTLAQSLGLHRDPTSWKSIGSAHEINVRIRLWWGVVILDHWSSISHGIPPSINSKYYDVPMASHDMFTTTSTSENYVKSTSSFIQLCKLTRILGDILPHVYSLQPDLDEVQRSLRKTENTLDNWLAALPNYLMPDYSSAASKINGASNLWFSYLSVKLITCRLAFKATLDDTTSPSDARQYRLSTLRQASCEVVSFITLLDHASLQEFWLPYTSYLLVTAATILLRCTVEGGGIVTKRSCVTKLVQFRDRLQRASEDSEWDLADACLERCHEPIQKIADALKVCPQRSSEEVADTGTESASATGLNDMDEGAPIDNLDFFTDFFLSEASLDHPLETLWTTFDESRSEYIQSTFSMS